MSDPLPSDGVVEGVGSATFRRGVGGCRIRYLPTGCRRRSSDAPGEVFGSRRVSDPLPSDRVSVGVGSATFRRGVGVGVPTPQGRFVEVGGCRIRYLPTGCRRVSDPLPSDGCRRVSDPLPSDGCRRRSADTPG